jgi:hypothetical protein
MKKIEQFIDYIEDELCDAEKYANVALDFKESDPATAELAYKLANEELTHMDLWHKRIVALIEAYKKTDGEPSAEMLWRYEYTHKKYIAHLAAVKGILSLYK